VVRVIGASLSEPQYSQEWYVHQVHENLRFTPHCCWIAYAHRVRKSILKEYGLPTLLLNGTYVANTKVYWKNTVCPTMLLNVMHVANTKVYWKNTVCPTLLLNGTYVVNTKVYWKVFPTLLLNGTYVANTKVHWKNTAVAKWYILHEHEVLRSALHVAMCATMSETQDTLQKRKERLQAVRLQPDGHLL